MSECGTYRYQLERSWGPSYRLVFCMLNPSTADAIVDDPTIRRCIGFAKRDGYDGITVCNAYALRATNPKLLKGHPDPIGPRNDEWLERSCILSPKVVVAWGANIDPARAEQMTNIFRRSGTEVLCLGRTKAGHPRHPLYIRADQPLIPYI